VIVCWSLKGGSGTTVVSAALALTLAQRNNAPVRIVDLAGDIPSALGIAEPSGEGVTNWLQQEQRQPIQSLQIPVTARVSLLPRGDGHLMHHDLSAELCNILATELDTSTELTVVDAGSGHIPQLINNATTSLLVIRPCYLALRKAAHLSVKPHGIVLIHETGISDVSVSTTRTDPYIRVLVTKTRNIPLFIFGWSVHAFSMQADVTIHIQDT